MPKADPNDDPDLNDQMTDEEMEKILKKAESIEQANNNNGP